MSDVKDTSSDNSSGSKDLSKSLPVEAFNNFLQGKRHMLVQDFQNAVASLAKACEMYVDHFGELAIECAEVYFLYGKALFRLSQQQAGVLGDALNDGSNEETSSENESKENESDSKENESDKNSDESEENEAEGSEQEKEEKEPSESTDSPPAVVDEASSEAKAESNPEKKAESAKSTEAVKPSEGETKESSTDQPDVPEKDEESKAAEGNADENTEEQEDDLELAWNTLETAKSIFNRRDTVESQLKVAEILQILAEISMESDNNAAAISDLNACLEIQKKHLKPDDRILAETYYQMGLALMLDKIYPEALVNFHTTKKILELRVENLKNTPVDDADGTFASADIKAEITDLENVLLDVKEKIDDTEELIRNIKKELEELVSEPGFSSLVKEKEEKSSTSKPVSNITHLLKRKKPDEGTSEDNTKRIKLTSVLNGDPNVTAPETANAEG